MSRRFGNVLANRFGRQSGAAQAYGVGDAAGYADNGAVYGQPNQAQLDNGGGRRRRRNQSLGGQFVGGAVGNQIGNGIGNVIGNGLGGLFGGGLVGNAVGNGLGNILGNEVGMGIGNQFGTGKAKRRMSGLFGRNKMDQGYAAQDPGMMGAGVYGPQNGAAYGNGLAGGMQAAGNPYGAPGAPMRF